MGLSYGADYGEGYYSSANAAVLHHAIKSFPDVATFRELADRVGYVMANAKRRELHPEIRKAGVHVQTVLSRLGSFEALNVAPDLGYPADVLDHAVDFQQVFTEPQLHYYHLSATLAPGSSPEIARLVTYSLLAAATQTQRQHQVYLIIDEFQRMVAKNIEYMLQLARSMGVGVILANQTMQDLRTRSANLIPAIEANCRYRQWFAVSSSDDRKRLIESSGETIDHIITNTTTYGNNSSSESTSKQERITPRLTMNDILLASDHPLQSIVRISRRRRLCPIRRHAVCHGIELPYLARRIPTSPGLSLARCDARRFFARYHRSETRRRSTTRPGCFDRSHRARPAGRRQGFVRIVSGVPGG